MLTDYGRGAAEAAGGVFDDGKGLGEKGVQGFTRGVPGFELRCLGSELVIREILVLQFDGVDALDDGCALPEEPPVVVADEELEDAGKHGAGREW
jgi:hypothetical protein